MNVRQSRPGLKSMAMNRPATKPHPVNGLGSLRAEKPGVFVWAKSKGIFRQDLQDYQDWQNDSQQVFKIKLTISKVRGTFAASEVATNGESYDTKERDLEIAATETIASNRGCGGVSPDRVVTQVILKAHKFAARSQRLRLRRIERVTVPKNAIWKSRLRRPLPATEVAVV